MPFYCFTWMINAVEPCYHRDTASSTFTFS